MVVSDIDDTVMISHSTKVFRKLRLMLFKNALTRSPFEGVAAFYKALTQPSNGSRRSVFYVSASEWNLYDLLVDFFAFRGIPKGPLLLSDTKMKLTRFWRSGKRHNEKVDKIKELFEFYPNRDFILIGDSGQKDPEIYLEILEMFPSRIKAIYIRHIGSKKISTRLSNLIAETRSLGSEMILARSTIEAARHAAEKGFIRKEFLEGIRTEKYFEEQKPVL
jgi:phosphatidate phosphatase APP1